MSRTRDYGAPDHFQEITIISARITRCYCYYCWRFEDCADRLSKGFAFALRKPYKTIKNHTALHWFSECNDLSQLSRNNHVRRHVAPCAKWANRKYGLFMVFYTLRWLDVDAYHQKSEKLLRRRTSIFSISQVFLMVYVWTCTFWITLS